MHHFKQNTSSPFLLVNVWVGSKGPILFFMISYILFKLELELCGFNTYGKDTLVKELYQKYLKEDKSDYRETIRRCFEISGRHR